VNEKGWGGESANFAGRGQGFEIWRKVKVVSWFKRRGSILNYSVSVASPDSGSAPLRINGRLFLLAGLIALWGLAIFGKLISTQVFHHRELAQAATDRQTVTDKIPAPRGAIFDRTGQPMALSVPAKSVYVNPRLVDLESAADLLSHVLHLDRADLYARLLDARAKRRGDFKVKARISAEEEQAIALQPVGYIDVREEKQRHYPNGPLAAHVLGSVDFDEDGSAGIERALNSDLLGVPGASHAFKDVKVRRFESHVIKPPREGEPLTLSIDLRLQMVAERELAAAAELHKAVSGSVVAMNPKTGEVLALASYPPYDPNTTPRTAEDVAARQNHAVQVPFEPGSVFKVITLSAALETTNLTPESKIDCHGGVLHLPGRVISDSHRGLGVIPMWEVLAKSSNVGAIEIGRRVGPANLYEYVRRFGFGQNTGIELPAESHGRLTRLERWGTTSWASISFGHEVSTTTVQLAQAASAVANGGLLVRPRLVLKKGGQDVPLEKPVRILKPETAITMRQMMLGVVEVGTGKRARLVGYSTGGKTGSATIFDFATKRYTHTYNGSFMGFAPLTNPAIVVVVTLNGTHGEAGFGGAASAPVFKVVAAEALRLMDVPEDRPEETAALVAKAAKKVVSDAPPSDSGAEAVNILDDAEEEQAVASAPQSPEAGPTAPNFRGMTKAAVIQEALAKGLKVSWDGTGIARTQEPAPGARLREGEKIRVVFAR
jgi:cell division protein FtsI (penicillin-binding protein 3)